MATWHRRKHFAGVGAVVLAAGAVASLASPPQAHAILGPLVVGGGTLLGGILGGGPVSDAISGVGASLMKEVLEFLIGDLQAVITIKTVRFLTEVDVALGPTMKSLTGPIVVIGGFFMVVGLITSVGDGYRDVVAGTDTATRVMGQTIFRVVGLAILLGSWFWIVPLAIEVANGLSGYLLEDQAMKGALARSFRAQALLSVNPLFALLLAVTVLMATLALLVLKFVMVIAFAMLYLGGPALIGFAALPRIGNLPLAIAMRGIFALTLVPLVWAVIFAAWAGVAGGLTEDVRTGGDALQRVITGPALFLAGIIIILGVTKRLLGLVTMGVPLSVPGSRIARSAAYVALSRGVGQSTAQAVGATEAGSRFASNYVGAGSPVAERAPTTTGVPAAAPSAGREFGRRMRPVGPAAPTFTREGVRAQNEAAERVRAAHDANAIATVRRGVWRQREARAPEYEAMGERVDELRTVWQEVPQERLREVGRELPVADRSGFAAAAQAALHQHPDDREAAWGQYRRSGVSQYAGRPMDPGQREAVENLLAASPDRVWEAFGHDYRSFEGRRPEQPAGGAYDPTLFAQEDGLERFKQKARRGESGSRPEDDLPF